MLSSIDCPDSVVVFNEVMYHPKSNVDGLEWVELYNQMSINIDLSEWRLEGGIDYTFPVQQIAAGGYLALDQNTLGFNGNDGDKLFLYSSMGDVVIAGALVEDRLTGRSPDGSGRWFYPDVSTFGTANSFNFNSDIVINEILYHAYPTFDGVSYEVNDEEWIELFNKGAGVVDLSDWKLRDAVQHDFPVGTNIAPGGYLIIAKDGEALQAKYPAATILGDFSGSLSNKNERIKLIDTNGNLADEVDYYDGGRWAGDADGGGSSLELLDPDSDNSKAEAWAACVELPKSSWQNYSYRSVATDNGIGNDIWHEFAMGLLASGEILIDDIQVIEDPDGAAVSFLQNGNFQADTIGSVPAAWRLIGTQGSHGRSIIVADPENAANKVLRLVATGQTRFDHNVAETTYAASEQLQIGTEYEISFRA